MSNSNLICGMIISPNSSNPRNHAIDTITIHCMAGNLTVEQCGNLFAQKSRKASSNYGIGTDGRIMLYVDEDNRSWCSSNRDNDNRSVTIEVANDGGASTGWHVSDRAMDSLVKLCADICKRNGIYELRWRADRNLIGHPSEQNMTVHRWFANKSCPGDYLYNKHFEIAEKVNAILRGVTSKPTSDVKAEETPFLVIVNTPDLNVREGAGTKYDVAKMGGVDLIVHQGEVFTITKVEYNGNTPWGKLKSGAGWISLNYTRRV